jgi:quercetin dioxygenase-like cupin family protein
MRIVTGFWAIVLAACFFFAYSNLAVADDAVKVAPDHYKVLLDNEHVRVLEFSGKKGDKIAIHSHPDCVVYFLADGKAKFTGSDGKVVEADFKKGETQWRPAETHSVEVVTDAHALLVELKQ